MGLRFRKSFKAAPGVKINVNKKSVGVTLGTRGAHYTINSKGKRTATVGIPGTGLSYTTTSGGRKRPSGHKSSGKSTFSRWIGIFIAVAAIVCAAGAIKTSLDKKAGAAAVTQNTASPAAESTAGLTAESAPAPAAENAAISAVWISGSGSKYHSRADCSGMENAREITLQEALDMGRQPCKRCYP